MTKSLFTIGDRVKLIRQINGKDNKFIVQIGSVGTVRQVYFSTAVRVEFDGIKADPVVAARYLSGIP
jgi:hypothetical protein